MFKGITTFLSTFMPVQHGEGNQPPTEGAGAAGAAGSAAAAAGSTEGGAKKGKTKEKTPEAASDASRKLREMVECPVCQGEVRAKSINQHLEGCLGVSSSRGVTRPSKSEAPPQEALRSFSERSASTINPTVRVAGVAGGCTGVRR